MVREDDNTVKLIDFGFSQKTPAGMDEPVHHSPSSRCIQFACLLACLLVVAAECVAVRVDSLSDWLSFACA